MVRGTRRHETNAFSLPPKVGRVLFLSLKGAKRARSHPLTMQKFYEGLGAEEGGVAQKGRVLYAKFSQRLQVLLDKSTPKPMERWLSLAMVLFIYFVRVSPQSSHLGPPTERGRASREGDACPSESGRQCFRLCF